MPAILTAPYPTADTVMNLTRSLGGDAIRSLAGNLLANSAPYAQPFLNAGYRHLQTKMAIAGHSRMKKAVQVFGLTPTIPIDPETRPFLSYVGYNDGSTNHATVLLPGDLCYPLRLKERLSGSTQSMTPMVLNHDGLQSRPQSTYLRDWVWEGDAIVFNGSTGTRDIEIYYTPFLPDLSLTSVPTSQCLIMRCENALAAYTLWQYSFARGSQQAGTLKDMGDEFFRLLIAGDAAQKARASYRRQGYSSGLHSGWGRY